MYKYTGDSILGASFTIQVPKPLDNRTVVNNLNELYSIPAAYAYVGMTVANIDNGNIYMLVDKSKIYEKSGWKASYESIQIISCTYNEYQEWLQNTDEDFQPIDNSKTYIHRDTYYYIYEDSLPGEEENQEYVKRSDWSALLNIVSGKASNDGLAHTNQKVNDIITKYLPRQEASETYAPLSNFDINNTESFIRTNFFTKNEALGKFVKFSDLAGGEEINEGDYIFVTQNQYSQDQKALTQYKQYIAEELAQCLKVGEDGELDSITISHIKSPIIDKKQLVIDITPEGLSIDGDPIAKKSDIPGHITLTKEEYDTLVENGEIDESVYYHIVGDDDTYVLKSELISSYYTKTAIESYIAGRNYTKQQIDDIIAGLIFNTPEQIAQLYVSKEQLTITLEDYVTIAMLGGDDMEGQFIFVKASDYQIDKETQAKQRTEDLAQIEENYIKKNSDASLNSLETSTIKNSQNILSVSEVLKLNNKKLALDEDVPIIQVVTQEEYEELTKDPNVYYFVYNTREDLAFVTAEELNNYYTKPQIDSKFASIKQYVDFLNSELLVKMTLKFNLEKILMERILDNQYYIARVSGNHIDIIEYQANQSVLTTVGTGLISSIRHMITNDTKLGNDIVTITMTCGDAKVIMTESGSSSDNPSTVSVQMLDFLRKVTGISSGDIKQSDLAGKIINMRLAIDTIYVDYKVVVKLIS